MQRLRSLVLLLVVIALLGAAAACGPREDAVARVNGVGITRAEFERLYQQVVTTYGLASVEGSEAVEYRRALLASLVDNELFMQEAERLKADLSDAAVDTRMKAMMGEGADIESFTAQVEQAGLTVDDVRRSIRSELAREFLAARASEESSGAPLAETYSLLEHILVADETTATALYEKIKGGADFGALAQTDSVDTQSGAAGGRLGWSTTDKYVDGFKEAADALKVGEVSRPVKSMFGWHIIRKLDEAVAGTPLSEIPEDLRALVDAESGERALVALAAQLKAVAKIEYPDKTLASTE